MWKVPVTLDALKEYSKNTIVEHLGIEFLEVGENFLKAKMPVDHRTRQPLGIMHGGASCVLAETLGSIAANCVVDKKTNYCVGLDINTNHIRSVSSGFVIGMTKPFHLGRSTQVWGIEVFDENQKLISVSRLTMAVLSR